MKPSEGPTLEPTANADDDGANCNLPENRDTVFCLTKREKSRVPTLEPTANVGYSPDSSNNDDKSSSKDSGSKTTSPSPSSANDDKKLSPATKSEHKSDKSVTPKKSRRRGREEKKILEHERENEQKKHERVDERKKREKEDERKKREEEDEREKRERDEENKDKDEKDDKSESSSTSATPTSSTSADHDDAKNHNGDEPSEQSGSQASGNDDKSKNDNKSSSSNEGSSSSSSSSSSASNHDDAKSKNDDKSSPSPSPIDDDAGINCNLPDYANTPYCIARTSNEKSRWNQPVTFPTYAPSDSNAYVESERLDMVRPNANRSWWSSILSTASSSLRGSTQDSSTKDDCVTASTADSKTFTRCRSDAISCASWRDLTEAGLIRNGESKITSITIGRDVKVTLFSREDAAQKTLYQKYSDPVAPKSLVNEFYPSIDPFNLRSKSGPAVAGNVYAFSVQKFSELDPDVSC